ncbi:MAG TPA: carboxymuconolactone decarboxylase family protein [Phycisphaerae bacterium]|nr:carboxymuconolactone decarboxylase family protein [Phycisphaerae bacterium]HRY71165.1 carboxymuconolactone decarboxylase family protein [Phycisphaerae bacterium]HSA29893.1 carboxymuconolactone decarboxylase family protein [Phycisphaerae bacterium]
MSDCQESTKVYNDAVAELVAIGAAIGANCEPCFKYHFAQARKLGVTKKDIALAVAMAENAKAAPAKAMHELAAKHVGQEVMAEEAGAPPENTCYGPKPKSGGSSCCCK